MSEIKDVHRKIEDEFVRNLQSGGIKPAATEELVCILSANKKPKAAELLDFYDRLSNEGANE